MRVLVLGLLFLIGCGANQATVPMPVPTVMPLATIVNEPALEAKVEAEELDKAKITELIQETAEEVEADREVELPPGSSVTHEIVEIVFADEGQASIAVLKISLMMGSIPMSEVYIRFFLVKVTPDTWMVRTAMPRAESMNLLED